MNPAELKPAQGEIVSLGETTCAVQRGPRRDTIDALLASESFMRDISEPSCEHCLELCDDLEFAETRVSVSRAERQQFLLQRDDAVHSADLYRAALIAALALAFVFFCTTIWEWL